MAIRGERKAILAILTGEPLANQSTNFLSLGAVIVKPRELVGLHDRKLAFRRFNITVSVACARKEDDDLAHTPPWQHDEVTRHDSCVINQLLPALDKPKAGSHQKSFRQPNCVASPVAA